MWIVELTAGKLKCGQGVLDRDSTRRVVKSVLITNLQKLKRF